MIDYKKLMVILLVGVFLVGLVGALDLGEESSAAASTADNFFTQAFSDWEQGNIDVGLTKILFLFLIAGLVFAALSYVSFPDNMVFRILIASIVSILGTYAFTPQEVFALLTSYSAAGIALGFFLPILILVFFTVVTVQKGKTPGVLVSKILWIIYSVYLLYKGLLVYLVRYGIKGDTFEGIAREGAVKAGGLTRWDQTYIWAEPILKAVSENAIVGAAQTEILWGSVFAIVGIVLIVIVNKGTWNEWLRNSLRQEDISRFRDTQERARAAEESRADATRGS